MAIHFQERVEVRRTPAQCFAYVDDFANTPQWNDQCIALQRESSDAREGGGLSYTYKQAQRTGVMHGEILERDPPRRLLLGFGDKLYRIEVGFRFDAIPGGTRIEHSMRIEPRSFVMKLLAPLSRRAMKEQAQRQAKALALALGG
ncbi:MAG: SRPBCC family protein [Planctomycetes bacterium]|nr:SRPBCC family protein [Planctomycetota bacterium]